MTKENGKNISRKTAIKRLGGLAAIPFLRPEISSTEKKISELNFKYSSGSKREKPNILWITLEGVPLSVLSCYGSKMSQTPNIDRIAKEGMRFNNSFCNNALCAPSRATLLTGKYNHLCGQTVNDYAADPSNPLNFFDPNQETFPKLLKKAGYKTGIAGKWHLESALGVPLNPADAGYDYFVFKKGAGGPYYNEKGFIQNPKLGSREMVDKTYPGYITDTFTNLAMEGIKQLKEPFCFCMQFFSAHRPFDPPHNYEHIFDNTRFPEPGTFWDDYKDRSSAARDAHMRIADMLDFNPPKDYTKRQVQQWNYQQLMRHFIGTTKSLDDNVGRLLDFLDKNKLSENTIVVITGDHGFFLGEHGWFDKRFMYEEALRVPWLVRFPGVVAPGSVSDEWVQSIDNAPTIVDMAGLAVPTDMQGKSLKSIIENKNLINDPNEMYYHYYEEGPNHFVLPHYGIKTNRYKLIFYYTINEWELFDLERDPDEMESLFYERGMQVKPGYEEVLKDLLSRLKDLREKYKDNTGKPIKFYPRDVYN